MYNYKDYITLNPDIAHLNEEEARIHWNIEGQSRMRLCNKNQLIVVSEFGPEIVLYICYYYYLFKNGLFFDNKITTYKGMKDFYYFINPENIIEKEECRSYVHSSKRPFLVNSTEHVRNFDTRYWTPVPYKTHFSNHRFTFTKPLLVVQNKYNVEWSTIPINYFSVSVLDRLFSTLVDKYTIIYIRPTHKINLKSYSFSIDHNEMKEDLKDYELIESKYKENVLCFDDILRTKNMSYNRLKLELFASCDNYISVQGGNAHMISFFYKKLLILHKRGSELAAGAYNGWYALTSPCEEKTLKVCETDEALLKSLTMF